MPFIDEEGRGLENVSEDSELQLIPRAIPAANGAAAGIAGHVEFPFLGCERSVEAIHRADATVVSPDRRDEPAKGSGRFFDRADP